VYFRLPDACVRTRADRGGADAPAFLYFLQSTRCLFLGSSRSCIIITSEILATDRYRCSPAHLLTDAAAPLLSPQHFLPVPPPLSS
jgi:hypothetical protein